MAVLVTIALAGCIASPESTPADPVELAVFLTPDITAAQQQAVEAELTALPGASEVTFRSSEQAYEEFKELFADSPEIVEAVDPDSMPASFRFTLADRADAEQVAAELGRLPGVDEVVVPPATPTPPAVPAVPTR